LERLCPWIGDGVMAIRDIVQAAAGVGGGGEYVEDVFSTYLYIGTGSAQTINNGIDLAGEGGLVWIKGRNAATNHALIDSDRGLANSLGSDTTAAQRTDGAYGLTFNSDGFDSTGGNLNVSGRQQVSWTFRKAPKFFSVLTYTGNGVAGLTIPHSLGSVPGCIIIKSTNSTLNWYVYHRYDPTKYLQLNLTAAAANFAVVTATSDTTFTLPADSSTNADGYTYVAYLFAHDAGGFGDDGEQNVISCGSFTTDGSGNATVNLGYEPQFILDKITTVGDWRMFDSMRGIPTGGGDARLLANDAQVENSANDVVNLTATGFTSRLSAANTTYIYIAIRRPMKTPAAGTEVFASATATGYPRYISNFPVDMYFQSTISGGDTNMASRLTGSQYLSTNLTNVGITSAAYTFDSMVGVGSNNTNSNLYARMFKRAPGFMDVVCYTSPAGAPEPHNLGVVPELIISKVRNIDGQNWFVNAPSLRTTFGNLNLTNAWAGNATAYSATSTTFNPSSYGSTKNMLSYLFATLAGVSKVGSYTGTGADLNVDCGFSAGARFILIKRTDSTGDWYVWDSVRGIAAGNDPYLLLNSSAAEVTNTDYIDPLSSGFTVTSSAPAALNASGGSYIFLAIA
jgi:hypothetical protein